MKTERIITDIQRAAELLQNGGLVAVPTETVYGLAGNGLDSNAVEKIYEVKGRPAVKPLSLMVPDEGAIERYCQKVPPQAHTLARRFWPGPLTIVLEAKDIVPDIVRAGGSTVGLRCPDHPMTLALLKAAAVPFAAPSANPSGAPSPKNADEVLRYFDGQIEAVCDGGPCGIGTESTLISLVSAPYRILRRGALGEDEIADALVEGMTVVGLTGGSGSGKTTALRVLGDMGALRLDADAIYHELLATDRDMIAAIAARFPSAVSGGTVDRAALGRIVFADASALAELNALTHRFVVEEIRRRLRAHAMNGGTLAAIDAVELHASGLDGLCARTYAVLAPREQRIRRIMARDGISEEAAVRRLNAQKGDDYYINTCDSALLNDGSAAAFAALCREKFLEDHMYG